MTKENILVEKEISSEIIKYNIKNKCLKEILGFPHYLKKQT